MALLEGQGWWASKDGTASGETLEGFLGEGHHATAFLPAGASRPVGVQIPLSVGLSGRAQPQAAGERPQRDLEVAEGLGGSGFVPVGIQGSGNGSGRTPLNRATWTLFQLQNRCEAHIQGDVQDRDCPRVEVLPGAFGSELRGR